ncbi:MAG: CinA family protein [Candidatus Thermoplasmatota archaeon]|nr:CinA family protein [Candidatus Thermoplasmatota archaeon]
MRHGSWEKVVGLSIEKGITIAIAESCTGGYISHMLTEVPGSSSCYLGGVVAYSDRLKMDLLGVSKRTLQEHGAVSREIASEMSRGIIERTGAEIGLSVTGIAGPSGGTNEKPQGTVFISAHMKDGRSVTEGFLLEGLSRTEFKEEVAERVIGMLLGSLLSLEGEGPR